MKHQSEFHPEFDGEVTLLLTRLRDFQSAIADCPKGENETGREAWHAWQEIPSQAEIVAKSIPAL